MLPFLDPDLMIDLVNFVIRRYRVVPLRGDMHSLIDAQGLRDKGWT